MRAMFDRIAPRYELCNRLFTFGLDGMWREKALDALGDIAGLRLLDLASGTGDLCRKAVDRHASPVGVDLSFGMLANSQGSHPRLQADAASMPFADACFDAAISGFALRNFTDLSAVLSEVARVLVPGAPIALLEVSTPQGPLLSLGHRFWFNHAVPVLGALLSDAGAYSYLPRSVAYLPSAPELKALVCSAGFSSVRITKLSGGITQLIVGRRSAG